MADVSSDAVARWQETQRQRKELFIKERTRIEMQIDDWRTKAAKLPEAFLSRLSYNPQNISVQSEIPEWYVEYPNQEVADQQVAALREKMNEYTNLMHEYYEQGEALSKEYDTI